MLNMQQFNIFNAALDNLRHGYKQVFEYSGRGGTGKTYTLKEICDHSNIPEDRILPMAYTGAAAAVLRRKGFKNATTLHSGLFTPEDVPNPKFKKATEKHLMNHQLILD